VIESALLAADCVFAWLQQSLNVEARSLHVFCSPLQHSSVTPVEQQSAQPTPPSQSVNITMARQLSFLKTGDRSAIISFQGDYTLPESCELESLHLEVISH
jgi:hypothetical protein